MRKADNLPPSCAVVTISGSFNFLEPSGPLRVCNGTALPLGALANAITGAHKGGNLRQYGFLTVHTNHEPQSANLLLQFARRVQVKGGHILSHNSAQRESRDDETQRSSARLMFAKEQH